MKAVHCALVASTHRVVDILVQERSSLGRDVEEYVSSWVMKLDRSESWMSKLSFHSQTTNGRGQLALAAD